MSKIRFLVRTDVHISASAPASRVDNYLETCLGKLQQIGHMAKKYKVNAVLDNGDFFHIKTASKNPHRLIKAAIDVHKDYPCPVYCNPGNHDFPYGRVDLVDQQPLGVLFAADIFHRMDDVVFEAGDLKVRVVGFPYKPIFSPEEFDIERGDEDILIVAAHTFASPYGGDVFGNEISLSYRDLAECSPDAFIFGHWHRDQGIQYVNEKPFFNLGALMRGSLVEDNLTRIPRVGLISIAMNDSGRVKISTKAVPLEVRPSEEIFDLEAHSREKEELRSMEEYLNSLRVALSEDTSQDMTTMLQSMEFHRAVKERALAYLEEVSS